MTTTTLHPLAGEYLERLRQASRGLPRGRRNDLVAEIESHLADAIGPEASTAEALTVLDRPGEPEAIVEAERPPHAAAADGRGAQEWAAIFLLLFGGLLFVVGWFAGVVLLWTSRAWTSRDKWIGTLIIPGGLVTVIYGYATWMSTPLETCVSTYGGPETCDDEVSFATELLVTAGLVGGTLASVATAIYLARRAGSTRPARAWKT